MHSPFKLNAHVHLFYWPGIYLNGTGQYLYGTGPFRVGREPFQKCPGLIVSLRHLTWPGCSQLHAHRGLGVLCAKSRSLQGRFNSDGRGWGDTGGQPVARRRRPSPVARCPVPGALFARPI